MLRLKNLASILFACLLVAVNAQDQLKWWQTASFYQIYPRSFQDSDGDGVGDLRGIAQRLAYLKEIGITATWLSPVFTSPMVDFGYDVANLTEIDPLFGTMEDYEALVAKAKEIGVKIILDFVPNHTSDECEWFVKSAARDPEYKDWYVWHPGKIVNGVRTAPTNWIGVFRGSMWTWHEGRQEYYLHQFHRKQPDLNYRNPKVVEAMKDVLRFWLRRGASGFRIDAVPHVFEVEPDAQGNYPDEAKNPNVKDPEDYESLLHVYTTNRPETIDLVYQFRKVIDEMQVELNSDDLVLMTEAYAPLNVQMQYYGNATMDGAQIPFNFVLIENVTNKTTAYQFKQYIDTWLNNMPPGRTANWVIGNHDRTRAATRLGEDRVDMINMLLAVLPGCSVTYLGEEIGMSDVFISWEDTQDPQACQSNPENFERLTRDPVRTPFQWSSEKNAGFSSADTTWLPVADNYKLVNVQRQRGIVYSHLNIFKSLRNLRQDPTMRSGATEVKALNANVLAVKRSVPGRKSFVAVMNLNDDLEVINLASAFGGLSNNLEYVLVTDRSPRRKGDWTHTDSMLLMPKEAVVLREV